jgi:hypothetical protein
MAMDKGLIYYTDNRVIEPIFSIVQQLLSKIDLPLVSVSLKPIDFGQNIVLENRERSYPTMVTQIIMALEASNAENVFFCENDVLYPPSHFDFIPKEKDVFYYNSNVWRWRLWDNKAIRYDGMLPLSCLCVDRLFALNHYKMRLTMMKKLGFDEIRSREPRWARLWGYEPGRKRRRRGGFSDDKSDTWCSELPVIDIRHKRTFSRLKCTLDDFKHKPTGWEETPIENIPGWDIKKLFNICETSQL